MVIAWRLALWLYPPETAALPGGADYLRQELRAMGPWSWLERKSAALMLIAVALWMTDFLHHIPAPMTFAVFALYGAFAARMDRENRVHCLEFKDDGALH